MQKASRLSWPTGIRFIVDLGCETSGSPAGFSMTKFSMSASISSNPLERENIAKYQSDGVGLACLDIVQDRLPEGELCLIRQVYQHLLYAQLREFIPKLRQLKLAVHTDYQPSQGATCTPNRDITQGVDTRIWRDSAFFLDQRPFNVPMQLLFETQTCTIRCNPGERIRTCLVWP
jgi:hypothetical protein